LNYFISVKIHKSLHLIVRNGSQKCSDLHRLQSDCQIVDISLLDLVAGSTASGPRQSDVLFQEHIGPQRGFLEFSNTEQGEQILKCYGLEGVLRANSSRTETSTVTSWDKLSSSPFSRTCSSLKRRVFSLHGSRVKICTLSGRLFFNPLNCKLFKLSTCLVTKVQGLNSFLWATSLSTAAIDLSPETVTFRDCKR
jgi:hypothetical protein